MRTSLLWLIPCLFLAACSSPFVKLLPQSEGVLLSSEEKKSSLCGELLVREAEIRTVRVLLKVKITYKDEITQLRYIVVLGENKELRIEALPPSGAYALAVLTSIPGRTAFLDVQQKKVTYAKNPEVLLKKFFGEVPLTLDTLFTLMRGRIPADLCLNALEINEYPNEGLLLIKSKRELALLDLKSLYPKKIFLLDSIFESPEALAEIKESEVDGTPRLIELTLLSPKIDVKATTEKSKINTPLEKALFDMVIPSAYEKEEL